jgi:hypothetical protein
MRAQTLSRKVRKKFYYSVPEAGEKIELGRTQSYEAAKLGRIPTEPAGKFLLVPRQLWDRQVKSLLRGSAKGRQSRSSNGA